MDVFQGKNNRSREQLTKLGGKYASRCHFCFDFCKLKNFPVNRFFLNFLLQSDNELLVSEMQKKKLEVIDFVSKIKRVENYPDLKKLVHLIQHGLQGFIAKNIEGESTEPNDLSHIL